MNIKLILLLSLFGLAMAVATVFWIPTTIEPAFWLPIFLFCAYMIAKKCRGKYFLHGLLLGLTNCVWVTSAHIIHFQTYIANHGDEAAMLEHMPLHGHPRLAMIITGITIGIASGLVLGLFAFIASKIFRKNKSIGRAEKH